MKDIKLIEHKLSGYLVSTVSARDLHTALESKKDFSDWIKARIKKYDFIEGEDFVILLHHLGEKSRPKIEYFLSLDMAKELGMIENTAKGREVRKYFIKCEKDLLKIQKQQLTVYWQEARLNSKCIRSTLTQIVQIYERHADKQGGIKGKPENRRYYSSITKRIYKQLFGDGSLKDVRDKLDALQLQFLSIVEQSCADEIQRLVDLDVEYHEIYKECVKRIISTVNGLSASKLANPNTPIKLIWDRNTL